MLELSENLSIRAFRLEANYTAARLGALDETRHLARDFEEAADKFALLEEEAARLELRKIETQAMVETADDAWDDTMLAFERRLLDLSGNSVDADLYRKYFSDIPSHVTSLSYAAEILISKELERVLAHEERAPLAEFAQRLQDTRVPLESILQERTHLEVDEARFQNRVALAKAILNKLRRVMFASLEEIAANRNRSKDWCGRFFHTVNDTLQAADRDGVDPRVLSSSSATAVAGAVAEAEATRLRDPDEVPVHL